ncbi:hypothetical protein QF019_002427 [Pseudomonas frederiksbergensis]
MKPVFWLLAAGLLVVMLAYNIKREASGVCQVPHSTTYRVFQ